MGCLGDNATSAGARATLTAAGLAERSGNPIGFWTHVRAAIGIAQNDPVWRYR